LYIVKGYLQLRNLALARVTFFNARREGEASRILLNDWEDATNNKMDR